MPYILNIQHALHALKPYLPAYPLGIIEHKLIIQTIEFALHYRYTHMYIALWTTGMNASLRVPRLSLSFSHFFRARIFTREKFARKKSEKRRGGAWERG